MKLCKCSICRSLGNLAILAASLGDFDLANDLAAQVTVVTDGGNAQSIRTVVDDGYYGYTDSREVN